MVNCKVNVLPGESIDNALRRLKKELEQADTMREFKRSEGFTPKGERRKTKNRKAAQRKIVKINPIYARKLDGPEFYG